MERKLQEIEQVIERGSFQDDWNSLSQVQIPGWFSRDKFGIFIHWGLYSIPAHNNEWYSRNMYIQNKEEWEYHRKTYGAHINFGYQDFIPLFQAEQFDPAEWVDVIRKSGARYAFMVAEHHDGFQMYKSRLSKYNAYDMGPRRDVLGELRSELLKQRLHFCVSSHRAEHWFFMCHGKEFDSDIKEPLKRGDFYWPAMPEGDHQDLQSKPYPSEEFLKDWLLRTCEIIDNYQPQLLYFDWWIQHEAFKPYLKKAAAYYYNRGKEWGSPTAICYKHDAMMFGSGIPEIERGSFQTAKPYLWQTDTSIANNSWCYTDTLDYKSVNDIVCKLIDVVSKNGNLLLNIGPKGDGSIPETDKKMLKEIGAWLNVNGEAIYESHVWRVSAEGSAIQPEGQFMDNIPAAYGEDDYRFTAKGDSIYVFVLKYPANRSCVIRSLRKCRNQNLPEFHGLIQSAELLGEPGALQWQVQESGLFVKMNMKHRPNLPVVIKVRVK